MLLGQVTGHENMGVAIFLLGVYILSGSIGFIYMLVLGRLLIRCQCEASSEYFVCILFYV